MKNLYHYQTKIGKIGIAENGSAITDLFFGDEVTFTDYRIEETPLLQQAAEQLREYLEGNRRVFDLPLAPRGTEFQEKVWAALQTISYGEACSYKRVAEIIGQPNACRAVGMANNRNPIAIIIPCHRVIGANGNLVGYGGGLGLKEQLLNLEKEKEESK